MKQVLLAAMLLPVAIHAAALTGRVIEDQSSDALASAVVRIGKAGQPYLAAELETGRDGKFQADVPPGDYFVEAAKPGFAMTKLSIHVPASGASLTARLLRRGVITGRVIDAQANPIAGANVFALPKPRPGESLRPPSKAAYASQITNAQGEYRLRDLPPGEYAIAANWGASTRAIGSSGRASTPQALGSGFLLYPTNSRPQYLSVSGGEQHRNIDFTILPGALFQVSGKVDPPKRYWLALVVPDQPALALAVAQGEADGSYKFQGVPPGSYRLIAVESRGARNFYGSLPPDNPIFAEIPLLIGGEDLTGVNLTATSPGPAEFVLMPEDRCPAAATLTLTALEDWSSQLDRTVELKAGQAVKVEGLPLMRFAAAAATEGDACYLASAAVMDMRGDARAGSPIEIRTAPAGSIRGKLDAGGKSPEAYAVFLAAAEDANVVEIATPDAQGRFTFTALKPGRYKIAASLAAGRTPSPGEAIEFEVHAGSNAEIDLAAPREVQ